MGHVDRPEEEDKGYEGSSESEGENDVGITSHPQVELLWCTCCCFSCYFFISLYIVRLKNTFGRKTVQEKLMAEGWKTLAKILLQQT